MLLSDSNPGHPLNSQRSYPRANGSYINALTNHSYIKCFARNFPFKTSQPTRPLSKDQQSERFVFLPLLKVCQRDTKKKAIMEFYKSNRGNEVCAMGGFEYLLHVSHKPKPGEVTLRKKVGKKK